MVLSIDLHIGEMTEHNVQGTKFMPLDLLNKKCQLNQNSRGRRVHFEPL